MLKSELLELLERIPDNAEIRINQPTHDYWRTHLAVDITDITEESVKPSTYHDGQDVIAEEWDEDLQNVWVIG